MTVVDLWTVQIIHDDGPITHGLFLEPTTDIMAEMEENLTDLLPPGYRARIRRWDQLDEGNDDE